MTLTEQFQWFLRIALRIFILAAVAFLSAITAMRIAIHGREVVVPNLVTMKAIDAGNRLGALGLRMKIEDKVFNDLPVDSVVRQSPRAGESVKRTQRVHVVVSLGPQKVSIPGVEGKSVRFARIELLQAGLQVGHVSSLHLAGVEADMVARQNPGPEAAARARSPRVNLLVSLGAPEAAFVMPDLAGRTLAEAHRRITEAGMVLVELTPVLGPPETRGIVVSQTPPRGSRVTPAMKVELQVGE